MDRFLIVGSLRIKIIFAVVIISVISFSIVISKPTRFSDMMLSNLTTHYANQIYSLLNASISPLVSARDYATIETISAGFVATKTIEFIRVRDLNNKVIALGGSEPVGLSSMSENASSKIDVRLITKRLMYSGHLVGHVDYIYSMQKILANQQKVIDENTLVSVSTIILTIIILIVVVLYFTRSIKQLASGAKKIAYGDLSINLDFQGRDEITQTATAFNQVVVLLQNARRFQNNKNDELAQQKSLVATMQTIAKMGYWRLSLHNNRISFSEECCELFGFEKNLQYYEISKLFEIIHDDDIVEFKSQLMKGISEYGSELNCRIVMSNGVEKVIHSKTVLLQSKVNSQPTLLGFSQDVTERYDVEKDNVARAKKESETRLRAAQKIASIGDLEWRVSDGQGIWADEVYEVFGVTREVYPPSYKNFIKLVYQDDREFVIQKISLDHKADDLLEFEYRVGVGIDEIRWINVILKFESHNKNSPARMVGIVQNISARKTSEDRAQLLQKQLQQSQKMEAVGQLTGGIAHDFNNILAVIMGYSGLALDRCVDENSPQLKEYLQEIYYAGERATELISQMMTFSRTSVNEPQIISIIPLVKEVCKMLGSIMPSSILLENHFAQNLSKILIDPIQLQQVLMNICINARDAMQGKGHLEIVAKLTVFTTQQSSSDPHISGVFSKIISCDSCHEVIIDGDYIELSVKDNGSGITAREITQIFEPFFTTKDVGKGTGMGLPMVHGIVHEHRGHILVQSVVGEGTEFKLLFPSVRIDSPIQKKQIADAEYSLSDLVGAKILVVDDENSVARYIAALFEKHGSQVSVFTNAKQALRSFQENRMTYDLLIIDQTMPELTGAEFAKTVLLNNPYFPIILCTGYSDNIDEDQAIKLGIRKYLVKPVNTNVLLNIANELISQFLRENKDANISN